MSETNTKEETTTPPPPTGGADDAAAADTTAAPASKAPRARRAPRGEKTCYNCGLVSTTGRRAYN